MPGLVRSGVRSAIGRLGSAKSLRWISLLGGEQQQSRVEPGAAGSGTEIDRGAAARVEKPHRAGVVGTLGESFPGDELGADRSHVRSSRRRNLSPWRDTWLWVARISASSRVW